MLALIQTSAQQNNSIAENNKQLKSSKYNMLDIILSYKDAFISGVLVTIKLVGIVWSVGILLGFILGVIAAKYSPLLSNIGRGISFVLSGIPVIVFLFWLHYPAQAMLGIVVDPFYTTAIALTAVNVFSVFEIVRSAIINFPKQYTDAAKVCGVKPIIQIIRIEIPIVFRHIIPHLLTAQVVVLHMTLFGSLISVDELFRMAQRVNSQAYKPVEIYSAIGLFFLMLSLPINGIALYLKSKYGRDFSEK
ncbi:amino acid ABC transporter permease [Endothiovibrio diazotrophicus]